MVRKMVWLVLLYCGNVPFNCQQPWLLGSSIPCRDSSSSLRRHILPRRVIVSLSRPRRVNFTESTSSSHRLVESSSSSQPCLIESSSQSHRVLVQSWSENRVVLVECWRTAWKFECLFIYFWASVERWLCSQKRWVILRVYLLASN